MAFEKYSIIKSISLFLLITFLLPGCLPSYYKLKEKTVRKRPALMIINDHLPTKNVIVHLDDKYWRLDDLEVKGDKVSGTLQSLNSKTRNYYNQAKEKKTIKIRRKNADESAIDQLHIFVDVIQIDNNQITINSNDITHFEIIRKRKGLKALIISGITIPSLFVTWFVTQLIKYW